MLFYPGTNEHKTELQQNKTTQLPPPAGPPPPPQKKSAYKQEHPEGGRYWKDSATTLQFFGANQNLLIDKEDM